LRRIAWLLPLALALALAKRGFETSDGFAVVGLGMLLAVALFFLRVERPPRPSPSRRARTLTTLLPPRRRGMLGLLQRAISFMSHSITWREVASEWGDGFDREIRVCNTDLEDWQPVFDGLATLPAKPVYTVDGVVAPLPTAAEALQVHAYASPLLEIQLGTVLFSCDFLGQDCIEFYFHPPSPLEDSDLAHVERLLRFLGETTGKPAELVHDLALQYEFGERSDVIFDPAINRLLFFP
jgi:hypothetical protein